MSSTTLSTVLGNYPHTIALKDGTISDPSLQWDFHTVEPVHKAFAPMVRKAAYELCELAIVTALQAVAYGRPIVILPVVVASRFQRGCIIGATARGLIQPHELAEKRIGVRAYTQTTGMWVRAHLAEDYGLPIERMAWITRDPAHVEQFHDPANVQHIDGDDSLPDQLSASRIDAAILGNDLPKNDAFYPIIADAAARDHAWWEQHGFMPINHMVVVSEEAARSKREAVQTAYQLLLQADQAAHPEDGKPRTTAFGFTRLQRPMQYVIDTCVKQGLLPHRLSVDEVFNPARKILGSIAD